MFIKIVQQGWQGFTGSFGTCKFKDGIAETTEIEAKRLGTLVKIVECTAEGFEFDTVNPAHDIVKMRHVSAPVQEARNAEEGPTESPPATVPPAAPAETAPVETSTPPPPPIKTLKYAREALEKLAGEEGIKGVRTIAEEFNLKGTSISGLIDAIMEAQTGSKKAGA